MTGRLLIDLRPAIGPHGERGIGRYVRGLAACIALFPDDLGSQVWALVSPGIERWPGMGGQVETRDRRLSKLSRLVAGEREIGRAARTAGAIAVHATDPHRPWTHDTGSVVVTAYDLIPLRDREVLSSLRVDDRRVYRRYLDQLRRAGRVIAISRATARDVSDRLSVPLDRIDIVYPPIEAPPPMRRVSAKPTFIVVGGAEAHKQPTLAVEAMARYHDAGHDGRLRFIGPVRDNQGGAILALAARRGIADLVSIEGRLTEPDLEAAFSSAAALISTSRIEGFGLPPVEAAVRGVPVIAVTTDAAMETLGAAAMLVEPDPEAIAAAMAAPIAPTSAQASSLRTRFSTASAAKALELTYRRVLDES